jgi:hypothetical protein
MHGIANKFSSWKKEEIVELYSISKKEELSLLIIDI